MKQSWLWKHVESRVGDRVRRMMRGNETGVAMLMALIFVVILIVTTTLVASVLIAQFAPYRRNTQNAQAAVVAENGLQSGLSYLREAEAPPSSLLPSTTTDTSKAALDDEYTVDATSSSGVKVVLNNASDTTSTTSTASTADYTTRNWTYSVTIQFYKDNPKNYTASELVSKALTPGDVRAKTNVNYAAVTSSAYFARYANGRTSSTKPVRVVWAVCKFGTGDHGGGGGSVDGPNGGRIGMGFYASAPYVKSRWTMEPTWKEINIDFSSGVSDNGNEQGPVNYQHASSVSDAMSATTLMNPANQTCMLATTKVITKVESLSDMLNPNGKPVEGSALIVLPQAYKQDSGKEEYTYTPQCQSAGEYKNLNNWVYKDDDSIRPVADQSLCVTGVPISETGGGNRIATLQKCGKSYGPNNQPDYYTDSAKTAQNAEKDDPDSLLNKYQKWAFYNGFINAGYLNDSGYMDGPISADKKTRFSHIEVSTKLSIDDDLSHGLNAGHSAGHIADFASLNARVVVATLWDYNLGSAQAWYDVDGDMTDATASFGQAGEAGYNTQQIVNASSGFCITSNDSGDDAYTDTCKVRGGVFDPFCYRSVITGKDLQDKKFGTGVSHYCPVAGNWDENAKKWRWKTDQVEYHEDESTNGSGIQTKLWTYTGADESSIKCYGFDGSGNFKLMDCVVAPEFTRYNDNAGKYKNRGTFQLGGKCLTEIYPGDLVGDHNNLRPVYSRSDGHPAIKLMTCATAGDEPDPGAVRVTDYLKRNIKSQKWNSHVSVTEDDPRYCVEGRGTASLCHSGSESRKGTFTPGSNGFVFTRELTRDGSI
ncbi:hypothetical protein [Bifidobacterium boum]|uniref:hypothetical protein n=1 Tax=Bifidobacterium boum TaxID=78343 RepID=UPI0024321529|nr:hypothetical protein [Bifidobacterium boum]MCI5862026.1 hypothetical protein [Bifidobacterium boum]